MRTGPGETIPAPVRICWRSVASVETAKPGGTGRPMEVISARLTPLPPSRCAAAASVNADP
ncbi:hypothetical protein M2159_008545 [Streptomyces sp. SAI-090]|jgi:hypothetical protein|nr:hypothetical protein [Streptomyces sp. SAI-090]